MGYKLAIVIPAYKSDFFNETLESIANQTCLDFTLYIGNDNSPEDLYQIVSRYESRIAIRYQKFEENLGGANLVSHWDRCIDLVQDEEWIWLFSDDDTMDANCVERFYQFINTNPGINFLHFDINIINEDGIEIERSKCFPENISITDFFSKRIKNEINSTVVEYIFKKVEFEREGGFKNYDLAWCSDDATWIRLARKLGITTIPEAKVNWRYSGANISSMVNDRAIAIRKLQSNLEHVNWAKGFFLEFEMNENSTPFDKFKFVISVILLTRIFGFKEKYIYTMKVIKNLEYIKITPLVLVYLLYIEIKLKFNLT